MAWGRGSLTLKHLGRPDLPPVAVEALADAGVWHLCIPESIRRQLALDAIDARDVTRADGTTIRVPYVGTDRGAVQQSRGMYRRPGDGKPGGPGRHGPGHSSHDQDRGGQPEESEHRHLSGQEG